MTTNYSSIAVAALEAEKWSASKCSSSNDHLFCLQKQMTSPQATGFLSFFLELLPVSFNVWIGAALIDRCAKTGCWRLHFCKFESLNWISLPLLKNWSTTFSEMILQMALLCSKGHPADFASVRWVKLCSFISLLAVNVCLWHFSLGERLATEQMRELANILTPHPLG